MRAGALGRLICDQTISRGAMMGTTTIDDIREACADNNFDLPEGYEEKDIEDPIPVRVDAYHFGYVTWGAKLWATWPIVKIEEYLSKKRTPAVPN
jgi:hypothetical protein